MSDEPFGFPQAEIPAATPLSESWARGDLERELRDLFAELFTDTLGTETFDASVLGAPHLGSFDLVRKMVGHDGLVLLRGEREEQATRYLYRAWRSEDVQGRGLHFLRTYLQLLVPNGAEVRQLWHDKRFPYGDALVINEPRLILTNFLGRPGLRLDGAWAVGAPTVEPNEAPPVYEPDQTSLWLTSRIQLKLSLETAAESAYAIDGRSVLGSLIEIIRTVIPARLVPGFLFWLAFELYIRIHVSRRFVMRKSLAHGYPWCGRSLSEYPDRRWSLGIDGQVVQLPLPFGSFRVGEIRGRLVDWRLRGCRAERAMTGRFQSAASAYRKPTIGEPDRRLDGAWALSRRQASAFSRSLLRQSIFSLQPQQITARLCETIRIDYPVTPRALDQTRALDGLWRLGAQAPALGRSFHGRKLDGFRIGRKPGILADARAQLSTIIPLYAAPQRLASMPVRAPLRQREPYQLGRFILGRDEQDGQPLDQAHRPRLSGWALGRLAAPLTHNTLRRSVLAPQPQYLSVRVCDTIRLDYPATPYALNQSFTINGQWRLGLSAPPLGTPFHARSLNGFPLRRGRPQGVLTVTKTTLTAAIPLYAAPQRLASMPVRAPLRQREPYQLGRFILGRDEQDGQPLDQAHRPRLSGWALGRLAAPLTHALVQGLYHATTSITTRATRRVEQSIVACYPRNPTALGRHRALDARWALRTGETLSAFRAGEKKTLNGFLLGRQPVCIDKRLHADKRIQLAAAPERLSLQPGFRLARWPRALDGTWALGALRRLDGRWTLNGFAPLKARKMSTCNRLGERKLTLSNPTTTGRRVPTPRAVNGQWQLGAPTRHFEFDLIIYKGTANG